MAIGFTVMLLSVSAGIHFSAGGFGLLLSFTGILVGANLVAVGVRMHEHPVVFDGACALAAFMCNTAAVGLIMASYAVTVVFGEADLVLCFAMFALLLLGVSLINVGARGE
jgi:hypothetical protein